MDGMALDEVKVKTHRKVIVSTGLALGLALVLSGCGRKSDLDPPNMPVEQQNQLNAKSPAPKDSVPDRPFILDPLL